MYFASASWRKTSRVMTARNSMMRSFGHQRLQAHALEIEAHQLLLFLRRQIRDVHYDREPVSGGFRQRKRALAELDRVHRRNGETEGRQLVGGLAHRHRAVL